MKTENGTEYERPPEKFPKCRRCAYVLTELDKLPCSRCDGIDWDSFVERWDG